MLPPQLACICELGSAVVYRVHVVLGLIPLGASDLKFCRGSKILLECSFSYMHSQQDL
jgi:hypothetical protein